jgi:tetratricopeptide (TPR) repeat protein
MAKELELVKADRENILAQTKSLLGSRVRAQELEDELGKVKASVQPLEDARKKEEEQNLVLKAQVRKLKEERARLTAERDELQSANDKLRNNTMVKELNGKIAGLQKELKSAVAAVNTEKNKVEADLRAAEKKIAQLNGENARLAAGKDQLTAKVEDQENSLAEAARKNKAFEQEIRQMPAKFVEVSRQNKVLLKQTAGMHYNMGVFYTKHREYDRAATEFAKALEIDPNDAYAHFNLGYIYAEYLINRHKAMDHFRHFLRLAKGDDPDVNWARKYLLTWETYDGKRPIQ